LDAWWREWEDLAAERHVAAIAPRPLLVAHGDADDVVPYQHAERLFSAAGSPKELARIPGGGHQLRRDARGVACLLDWLDRL
ncbi:MAG: serine aminopeptidase domain-containing protein, partial [Actinomycetota bacterium]